MTRNEINQICVDYIRQNLSPTKRERDFISSKYGELKKILQGRTFQNGSYARHTSTTPVNDLDVFYVIEDEKYPGVAEEIVANRNLDISNILEDLAELLRKAYRDEARIKVQPHSVGIFFGDDDQFSIDVVPAIPADDGMFWVPESSHLSVSKRRKLYEASPLFSWIKSDPEGYRKDAADVDLWSGGSFRKTAKFIKKWKQGCKDRDPSFALKSFHLELIVTAFYKDDHTLMCLNGIEKFFNALHEFIEEPKFPDKADESRFIDEYLTDLSEQERKSIIAQQNGAIAIMKSISDAETEAEVLKLIEELLQLEEESRSVNIVIPSAGAASRVSPATSRPYYSQ